MAYPIVFAPQARDEYEALPVPIRAEVRRAIKRYLSSHPTRISRDHVRRFRTMRKPQYRLRVGNTFVFYDVREDRVEVLTIVEKAEQTARILST